jgi:hypothetical protein
VPLPLHIYKQKQLALSLFPFFPPSRDFDISIFLAGAPTEEPRPDASNARSQRPATKGNWRVSCPCMCVETPVAAHMCFALSPVIHPVRVHKYQRPNISNAESLAPAQFGSRPPPPPPPPATCCSTAATRPGGREIRNCAPLASFSVIYMNLLATGFLFRESGNAERVGLELLLSVQIQIQKFGGLEYI